MQQNFGHPLFGVPLCRRVPPSVAKTCAVRPVFVLVVGELWAADPSKCPEAMHRNASWGHNLRLLNSGKKKEPKPKLFGQDIFGWGGGLPREGLGGEKFGMSLETRQIKLFWRDIPGFCRNMLEARKSRSPKAGHNKAGRSDFRNQRFEPDTAKMRKMRTVSVTPEKQGSEGIPQSENAENAENAESADTKTRRMRKMRLTGFNVTGFR